ncbi:hypothetical protein BDQ17DRAFT_1412228 [Cyathus striatus]|nr:hypothetical protein BDQ17DRAFT_1412228 [Cyathus striatus]
MTSGFYLETRHSSDTLSPPAMSQVQKVPFSTSQSGSNIHPPIHTSLVTTPRPGHLPVLYDLLSQGLITTDKFCEMYSSLMRADKETISEINAVVDKNGKGKKFEARSIYNSTSIQPTRTPRK